MAVELDYMEYSSDANAQAAYVSSDTGTQDVSQSHSVNNGTYALGNGTPPRWNAMKYVFTTPVTISQATVYFNANSGTPSGNVTARFETDSSGSPSGSLAHANATVAISVTPSSSNTFNWTDFTLSAGTYWLVLTCDDQTAGNYWTNAHENAGYTGYFKTTTDYGVNWVSSGLTSFYSSISATAIKLQDYSESTIKTQGSYSLKGIALATGSLNDTLTRTIGSPIDLTGQTQIKYDQRASRTGSNIKIGIHDSGGTTTEFTHNQIADEFETVTVDISGVADADKDAIDSIIATIVNADGTNTFFLDNMYAETVSGGGIMTMRTNFWGDL